MARIAMFFTAALGALLVSACEPPPQLRVEAAYVQMSPIDDRPSAAYFDIIGGPDDVKLINVSSPDVLRVETHETVETGGVAKMQQLEAVIVPSKEKVSFAPGGKHLMIWGIGDAAQQAGQLTLQFVFSNGKRIEVDAVIRKIGDATAHNAAMDQSTMDHGAMDHGAMGDDSDAAGAADKSPVMAAE